MNSYYQNPKWKELMGDLVKTTPYEYDSSEQTCFRTIDRLNEFQVSHQKTLGELDNEQLRDVFYLSPCLGFLLWQHLAALESIEIIAKTSPLSEFVKECIGKKKTI